MSTVKCYRCLGLKVVMGLGNINHECDLCNATGYIADELLPPIIQAPEDSIASNLPKRKGRPPRINADA